MSHRHRRDRSRRPPPGAPPGALSGAPDAHPASVHRIAYDAGRLVEHHGKSLADIDQHPVELAKTWMMGEVVDAPLPDLTAGAPEPLTHRLEAVARPLLEGEHEAAAEHMSGLFELHLSSLSTRTNEIMKLLTIIATIFIPLGFIAGLYGMNFDPDVSPFNMPELGWRFGYPLALGLMASVALGLLGYFYRKGWIGGRTAAQGDRSRARPTADGPTG